MKKALYSLSIMVLASLFSHAQTPTADTKVSISKLNAYEKDSRLFVDWSTDEISNTNYWEVQGSPDGKRFSTIALVLGPDPAKQGAQYGYKDKINSKNTAAWYRVVHVSTTGERHQSNIIKPVKGGY